MKVDFNIVKVHRRKSATLMTTPSHPALKAFQALDSADQDLTLQLALCSGSLKELAKQRQVSYPTIRLRLNRLISRLEAAYSAQPLDPMAEALADLVERGEMTINAAKSALAIHRTVLQQSTDTSHA